MVVLRVDHVELPFVVRLCAHQAFAEAFHGLFRPQPDFSVLQTERFLVHALRFNEGSGQRGNHRVVFLGGPVGDGLEGGVLFTQPLEFVVEVLRALLDFALGGRQPFVFLQFDLRQNFKLGLVADRLVGLEIQVHDGGPVHRVVAVFFEGVPQRVRQQVVQHFAFDVVPEPPPDDFRRSLAGPEAGYPRHLRYLADDLLGLLGDRLHGNFNLHFPHAGAVFGHQSISRKVAGYGNSTDHLSIGDRMNTV